MRSYERDEFAGSNNFGLLPELWEMALIARHKIIGAGCIRAFQEDVVVGIACNFQIAGWNHGVTVVFDQLKQLLAEALANA